MKELLTFCGVNNSLLYGVMGREELQNDIDAYEKYSNFDRLPSHLVFISVANPDKAFISTGGYFKDELFVRFSDIREDESHPEKIAAEQGKEIFDFIIKNKGEQFIVNCEYGVSRSAGIAKAIEYIFRDKELYPTLESFKSAVEDHWRYAPNEIVFNSIIKHEE